MQHIIPIGIYKSFCNEAKIYKSSQVALSFNIGGVDVKKIIKYDTEEQKDTILRAIDKACEVTIIHKSNGTEHRISELSYLDNGALIYVCSKVKRQSVAKPESSSPPASSEHPATLVENIAPNLNSALNNIDNTEDNSVPLQCNLEDSLPSKMLKIEREILKTANGGAQVPDFLYKDLPQFDLVNRFFSDYENNIRVFCSKNGFISRKNPLGNREYILDVPLYEKLFKIAERRCESKTRRYSIKSEDEIDDILRNEIQGIIGEQTKVKFFNALWSFLSINKVVKVNEYIYDSAGDAGTDFLVGVFDVDVKQRNRPPNADILLNKKSIDSNVIILLVTCLTNHKNQYYHDLYKYFSEHETEVKGKLVHQSVLTGYTDALNYNKYSHIWGNGESHNRNKYSLDYYRVMPMDDYIKLMIIEALKEEVRA